MKKREDMIKKFLLMLLSAAVVSAAAGPARAGAAWLERAKLIASDGAAEDYFGVSVSISGDYAIVGAQQSWGASQPLDDGKAYIFRWDGAGWSQQQKLLASDGAAGDWFGQSVSISGDLVIVGAQQDDDKGNRSGSAYIFKRDGTGWVQQQKLLAADGAAGDRFGRSVSLSGDFAIVGAPQDDDKGNSSGSAYIFKWNAGSWVQQQKLLAADGAARDQFGPSVSISGDLAIVGAPGDADKGQWTGSAYIFKRDGTSWVQQQKLVASDGAAGDRFGVSVSISRDLAVVGAYWDDDACPGDIACDSGSAYILNLPGAISRAYALGPRPFDGTLHADTWVNLSWWAGDFAVSHDVYLGENFDEVNAGAEGTFVGNQAVTSLIVGLPGFAIPDGLVAGMTYYWRIDEVNETEPNSPWKGSLWSFAIPPKTAYAPDPADGAESVGVDVQLNWTPGFGARIHTVYLGDNYDDVSNAAGGVPLGDLSYDPGTLEREKILFWRVDEFDGAETHKGDVWSFTTPGAAGSLQPANGAVDVQITSTLSWTPADTAASHELYFGTDADAVKNATRPRLSS